MSSWSGTTAAGMYSYDDSNSGIPLSLQTNYDYWFTYGSSTASIRSGSIYFLTTADTSTATVSGGSINTLITEGSSAATVSGGRLLSFYTADTSTVDVLGTGLTETLIGRQSDYVVYAVTGALQDGISLAATYDDFSGTLLFNGVAAVPINPVPEASSVVSFSLLLTLGLGGLMVSARRRKTHTTE